MSQDKFNYFVRQLEKKGIDADFSDERTIKKKCGRGIYDNILSILVQADRLRPLIFVFRDEVGEKCCWASKDHPGEIIVNLAKSLEAGELDQTNRIAWEDFKSELELQQA